MSGHTSVLYHECLDALRLKSGGVYIDGTLGGGGHSEGILKSGAQLIAFDKDGDAIERCKKRLAEYAGSFTLVRRDFKDVRHGNKSGGRRYARLRSIFLSIGRAGARLFI